MLLYFTYKNTHIKIVQTKERKKMCDYVRLTFIQYSRVIDTGDGYIVIINPY